MNLPAMPAYRDDAGNLVIVLPVPNRGISPNARRGESKWAAMKKAKLIRAHRMLAYARALDAFVTLCGGEVPTVSGYSLSHFFKTAAYRDDDNADAACKAYRDGIADALGMDDQRLRKVRLSEIGKDSKCPRVEIALSLECRHDVGHDINGIGMWICKTCRADITPNDTAHTQKGRERGPNNTQD